MDIGIKWERALQALAPILLERKYPSEIATLAGSGLHPRGGRHSGRRGLGMVQGTPPIADAIRYHLASCPLTRARRPAMAGHPAPPETRTLAALAAFPDLDGHPWGDEAWREPLHPPSGPRSWGLRLSSRG